MFFNKKEEVDEIENKIIDNIKALNIDIINTKHNGNFDISLGLTKALYTLYGKHLRFDKNDPNYINRDRVILSSSSAYSLLLSTLYMSGFNISLDELKSEYKTNKKMPGIDLISDTFGEGLAIATGISIGEAYLHEYFKKYNDGLIDFYTYVICSDLDLVKGTTYESLTLASSLKLKKLIILFDNNKNVLADNEKDIFNIDILKYFESLNLNTISVNKNDLVEIDNAITKAKSSDKPSVIILNHDNSHDRFENNYIDSDYVLTEEETTDVKNELGVRDIPFTVSSLEYNTMQEMINERMESILATYNKKYESLDEEAKQILEKLKDNDLSLASNTINYDLIENESLDDICYKVLNSLIDNDLFIGGTSNFNKDINSKLENYKYISSSNPNGTYINYGLRENAIASIQNGLSFVGIKNFSITSIRTVSRFIPAIRLASNYNLANIYIVIDDEDTFIDGIDTKTYEDLVSLRNIPNLEVYRPSDHNEIIGVFKLLASKKNSPSFVIIGKNTTKVKENSSITDVKKGAYIIKKEDKNISAIIISNGSEMDISLDVSNALTEKGYDIRVISMTSLELFEKQPDKYKEELIPFGTKVFVIEKSSSYSWYKYVYNDKYLITSDKMEWYKNEEEKEVFKDKIIEKIENLLK